MSQTLATRMCKSIKNSDLVLQGELLLNFEDEDDAERDIFPGRSVRTEKHLKNEYKPAKISALKKFRLDKIS